MRFPKTIALAGVLALASSGLGWALSPASDAAASTRSLPRSTFSVTVQGNHLVNGNGQTIRLLGVNRSGSEYACAQGWGIFDGPSDATSIAAIAAWHTNVVRVPLNEDCWLGINGVASAYAGANYQGAIAAYVSALHAAGLYAILELHWNAPGTTLATSQQPMPDADHSPAFWSSVAASYKNDPAVIFDLYNEPYPDRTAAAAPWGCWRDGCSDVGFAAAGMQSLVNAVRAAGATTQPIMLGGLGYSSDLSKWLTYKPTDPNNGLVGSFHLYNFAACLDVTCWSTVIAGVAVANPVVTGELGENDCAHTFIDTYMPWADTNGVSYLGWAWNPYDCSSFPSLITGYDGTPTAFGIGLRDHFASLASAGVNASSSGSPRSGAAPLTVGFIGSASGGTAPYSYSWNFGDGSATSTVQSPSHPYAAAGNYSAVLTVTDALAHTNSAPALSVSVTSLPGAPTVVSASPRDASANVSWTAPAGDGNSAITGYSIIPYLNGTTARAAQVFNTTATGQHVTGLTNGSSYKFTVAAINAVGTGPESPKSNSVTPVDRFPVLPNPGEATPPARDPVASAPPAQTPSRTVAGYKAHLVAPQVVPSRSSAALAVRAATTPTSERRTHWTWGRITYS